MKLKHLLLTVLILSALFVLISCRSESFTVTFDSNGGNNVETQIVPKGNTVTKPETPEKEGYTFKGWYNGNTEWSFLGDTVTENVILKAKWEKNKYTVIFDANGGSGGTEKTVEHGSTITAPIASKPNHSFIGWFNGDTQWSFKTDVVTSNLTLVAKWEGFSKTVTFDANGGTVSEEKRKVKYGEEIDVLPTPTKSGFTFLGWYDSDDVNYENRITKDYIVTSNVKLVAKWGGSSSDSSDSQNEHKWSTWTEFTGANCDEAQTLYRACIDCGEVEYKDGTKALGHEWSSWDTQKQATCYDNEVLVRFCSRCGDGEEKDGVSALGHNLTNFEYSLMSHTAYCTRCKTTLTYNYENLASSIKKTTISGNVIGAENVNCLYNGIWDETSGTFCAKGGSVTVDIEFPTATDADVIYIKGKGGYTYNLYVLYEGDSEYTMVGMGSFGNEPSRFDLDRKITKISIQMENGGNLDGYWQEVAIVKIPQA